MTRDPRFPPDDRCVTGPLLRRQARERGEETFAVFADGSRWTYAETLDHALRAAGALRELGVGPGDRVLCWLPNGPDVLRAWFGANLLGAVYVPMNVALRGGVLRHVIDSSRARVLVAHRELVERLPRPVPEQLEALVVAGGEAPGDLPARLRVVPASLLRESAPASDLPDVGATDLQSIVYTSGTTGPSKGVLSSYLHLWSSANGAFDGMLDARDRYIVHLPLFHAGGTIGVAGMMALGGSIAVVDSFQTTRFWDVVRELGVTAATLLGVMATFLAKQPPGPRDRDHPLRTAIVLPMPDDAGAFRERFGVDLYSLFNMTEVSCPLVTERNPAAAGTCGRPRQGVEARLVDEHDREVPVGAIGQLILRTDLPWAMNHGYDGMPEATAEAWRNGWFHTGDVFRRDAEGNFFFVDRMKDAIRRRGENISSHEVETEVLAHPRVREVAAVPVPSEHGEDEVLIVVAPVAGAELDLAELIAFCARRMAHYMVPRYVRVVDALPLTPTNKVRKHELTDEGLTADTWDREQAGIRIRRQAVGSDG